ncbi:hypothetical protein BJG93_18185 [Paraburkholderia sprentiae WSM5005]|uniref:Uncharacterized protein n=1 Tax=Paraburkholderia sprentiae WSM5005 TaxID=754502 RepID=A0A1I9YMA1_9BURK|nr:hypothetical protein [Paraburkholderia sprentiae]APA87434.1 hypothetical protein BJG93_18185 [Paraburkholderia sprentiae WSM5005]
MASPHRVQVTLSFHPEDYAAFKVAARATGLDELSFGVLAVHREARRVLAEERHTRETVPNDHQIF